MLWQIVLLVSIGTVGGNSEVKEVSIKAGDIAVCIGQSPAIRREIKKNTGSDFTHTVIFVKDRNGKLYVLNAYYTTGVKLIPADRYLKKYKGKVFIRQLKNELSEEQGRTLMDFAETQAGKEYAPLKRIRNTPFLKRFFEGEILEKIDLPDWFCSEIVAEACRRLGFISNKINPSSVTPGCLADNDIGLNQYWQPVRPFKKVRRSSKKPK